MIALKNMDIHLQLQRRKNSISPRNSQFMYKNLTHKVENVVLVVTLNPILYKMYRVNNVIDCVRLRI